MKEIVPLPFDALEKGYILIPKHLLEQWLHNRATKLSELDAWLTVLATVNYKDISSSISGHVVVCKRGESLHSLSRWARCFRWSYGKTRCFFARLQAQNLVQLIPHPHTTHLQIVDYDLWVGCRTAARHRTIEKANESFDAFWETYHRITQADRVNIARARREWQKLSTEEQTLATHRVEEYYYHLRNVKYCMQAAAYLSNKAFLNEYND